jgi:hypothetical protein
LGAQPKSKTHDFLLRLQCICYTPNINIANIHPLFVEWCDLNPRNSSSLEMEDDVNVVLLDSTSQDSIFSHATRNYNQDLARDRVKITAHITVLTKCELTPLFMILLMLQLRCLQL